ncbi:MAG: hypothetical protein ACREMJ_09040 [Gemmatimonadales bacterium]
MRRSRARNRGSGPQEGHDETLKRKNYRLHQAKLDTAQRLLGTKTETETIERALDLVAFGERLATATERARGRPWNDLFGEMKTSGAKAKP